MSSSQLPAGWAKLISEGLLDIAADTHIHPTAIAIPVDRTGVSRRIMIGEGAIIGAHTILHGGTELAAGAEISHDCIVGVPETGYALRAHHVGKGNHTFIGAGAVLRAGAIAYAGVTVGPRTTIGHRTILRTNVAIGSDSQIAHGLTVERDTHIGQNVRCSPLSHLTAQMHIGDGAFIGAGVRTINDKYLIWRDPVNELPLDPPRIEANAKVGTGAILLAGVTIGSGAVVGAGSIVTRDVAPNTTVWGSPAKENGVGR